MTVADRRQRRQKQAPESAPALSPETEMRPECALNDTFGPVGTPGRASERQACGLNQKAIF
jgi:hypothetical protein